MSSFIKEHFRNLEALLKAQTKLCSPAFPTYDIGLNREFFVREVLRTHLPPFCEITSGCICDDTQNPTAQIDIILFHPLTFRVNIGATECCISESVFAALEVKSHLKEDHFKGGLLNLANIRRLSREHLYSHLLGATWNDDAYHFNTLGTVLFGYRGYSAVKCAEVLRDVLKELWIFRPEAVYSLEKPFLLIRDDYLKFEGDDILQTTGQNWIESLNPGSIDGYWLIEQDCLLVLICLLSMRIQSNYHLLPKLHNYVAEAG